MEPIKQRTNKDCVRTCMAMVTGYDYDVLPSITLLNVGWIDRYVVITKADAISNDIGGGATFQYMANGAPLSGMSFNSFRSIYRKYFGLRLSLHRTRPINKKSICISPDACHAFVQISEDMIVDPKYGQYEITDRYSDDDNRVWITVEAIA